MERVKNMGLKKTFFLLSALSMVAALAVIGAVFMICREITADYPTVGIKISYDGIITEAENPTREQMYIANALGWVEIFACILIPTGSLCIASMLFYRYKLKKPITVLQMGTERIREHDLTFSIPVVSADELGQVCAAFEMMRIELAHTNQELWRQAEERKRLNAAFSHDLRNPVTVLKGTVKLLRQGTADEYALDRLETYVLRIEQYVEAMSSIQRLEQMPVQKKKVDLCVLKNEVEETAKLFAQAVQVEAVSIDRGPDCNEYNISFHEGNKEDCRRGTEAGRGSVMIDHGLFLTVAENLIGNAARYAKSRIHISLSITHCGKKDKTRIENRRRLLMTVSDDGKGYPVELLQGGPKPFGRMGDDTVHFGMGLYTSQMLCMKHGGTLVLENEKTGGAKAMAVFSE